MRVRAGRPPQKSALQPKCQRNTRRCNPPTASGGGRFSVGNDVASRRTPGRARWQNVLKGWCRPGQRPEGGARQGHPRLESKIRRSEALPHRRAAAWSVRDLFSPLRRCQSSTSLNTQRSSQHLHCCAPHCDERRSQPEASRKRLSSHSRSPSGVERAGDRGSLVGSTQQWTISSSTIARRETVNVRRNGVGKPSSRIHMRYPERYRLAISRERASIAAVLAQHPRRHQPDYLPATADRRLYRKLQDIARPLDNMLKYACIPQR